MNKDLYGEIIYLPKELIDHLTVCFESVPNGDSNTEGFLRNQELRNNGMIVAHSLDISSNKAKCSLTSIGDILIRYIT